MTRDTSSSGGSGPLRRRSTDQVDKNEVLAGGGEMGALMRSMDWNKTALGPLASWPNSLRTAISMMLESRFAMVVAWGPEFRFFYNDRYRPVLGAAKHPSALGSPAQQIFPEAWPFIGPLFNRTRIGESVALDDELIPLDRNGYLENCYFTLSYSAIRDETGGVGGMLAVVAETTERVQAERRLATLRDLLRAAAEGKTAEAACTNATRVFDKNLVDLPFTLLYLVAEDGRSAQLASSSGLTSEMPASPNEIDLTSDDLDGWPVARAVRSRKLELITDLPTRFGTLPGGPYPEPTHTAVIAPLAKPGGEHPHAILIAGVSPRRAFDDAYHGFFDLASDHILTAIANARAFQDERERAEALAEIDRAKTAFFSNVSHEFRTPLTLMLGPVEDALTDTEHPLDPEQRARTELVRRNGLRLQKLVNTLLDFARIEAGRARASFVPTDLASLTADLASSFRSAVENAGLQLTVDCPALPAAVYVDPSMWEKIVFNLLSNAFKFTFEGDIRVVLRSLGEHVELSVEDTGTGIAPEELPRVFERFHRVEGARGRSFEGTGIGLALVQELAKLHGGGVDVKSTLGRGSIFRVSIPTGSAHLPQEYVGTGKRTLTPTGVGPAAFLAEIAQWSSEDPSAALPPVAGLKETASVAPASDRVLVVDDNADMRAYVARLLSTHWQVETVSDGARALAAARANPPDLILADVMMPGMDGLALLRALRDDERTRIVPVVLLSARAGEEATIAGFASGADDYLIKPFSANELRARVKAQLSLAHLRNDAIRKERKHLEETEEFLAAARAATRSREDMVAIVSHDLRAPLSAIRTAAELIERARVQGEHAERVRNKALLIERSVDGMDRLIGNLLDIASIESGTLSVDRRPHTPGEIVSEVKEIFAAEAEEKGLALTTEIAPDLPPIPADRERIVQALSNLVGNAIKFTSKEGTIRLSAKRNADGILFAVSDSGTGISAEAMKRIFDRYWHSAQKGRKGHGLGLSIAKGIVEAHGGTIVAESEPGRGSTFTFILPADGSSAMAAPNGRDPLDGWGATR